MFAKRMFTALLIAAPFSAAQPVLADPAATSFGAPVALGDGTSFDPIVDARLRWEDVNQPTRNLSADAVTMRVRAGFEVANAPSHLSFLAEAEGNLALDGHYNAFPFVVKSQQSRPGYAVVADPENIALNRLQLAYRTKALSLTVGRQVINLDDERWVGASAWRQNEQTYDAARGTASYGPLALDVTYADSQRTVFGVDSGARIDYDGRFWFLGAAAKTGPVTTKAFAYLLDYDPTAFGFQSNSSQTYGVRSAGTVPLAKKVKASFAASYARQQNYKDSPYRYRADYIYGEGALAIADLTLKGGYEKLGADASATRGGKVTSFAVQTPMATFHKWDGWADQFLTTPTKGLQRVFASATYKFSTIKAVPRLNAQVIYHDFHSDIGNLAYGHEWDGAIGWKTGPITWLAKYADYTARLAGTNTRKFWLQAEFAL
ncbi:MAG: alginate export family protein [Pseudomonadota bacterium]|nr:alginate export family protein [Pseudomonadota bacterium]